MQLLNGGAALSPHIDGTAVTVGTFDGVHRGHLDVIASLVQLARRERRVSVVVTFDPHPLEVVNAAAAPPLLTTLDEKLDALAATDVDYVAVIPFTRELADLSAEHFVDDVLRCEFRMADLLIGHDHGFGRERAGNARVLQQLGRERGFSVTVVEPVSGPDGHWVSSTAIRRAVAGGDLHRAADLLGRPYSISGTVVRGAQRGRAIGFPTVNLSPPSPRKLLPPDGVYAVCARTEVGTLGGMMNLGPKPTFADHTRSLETYLFDVDADFYGQKIRIDVLKRLRDTRAFTSPAQLIEQIQRDETAARAELAGAALPALPATR